MARPFLQRVDEQAGIARGFHIRLDRLVERPRVGIGRFSRVRDDRRLAIDLRRQQLIVDPRNRLEVLVVFPARDDNFDGSMDAKLTVL